MPYNVVWGFHYKSYINLQPIQVLHMSIFSACPSIEMYCWMKDIDSSTFVTMSLLDDHPFQGSTDQRQTAMRQ